MTEKDLTLAWAWALGVLRMHESKEARIGEAELAGARFVERVIEPYRAWLEAERRLEVAKRGGGSLRAAVEQSRRADDRLRRAMDEALEYHGHGF